MKPWLHLLVFFLLQVEASTSQSIVETLPGYPGTLPFKLETGYIGVGENDGVQLFYYFIESESDPQRDPLVLWLTGGPGCSGFSGLVYENIGPLLFDVADFDGSLPSLTINPYSWTKVASFIFIDSPVGTGFSYANASEDYATSDTKSAQDNYTFLRKWLSIHPTFLKNRLYIAGDSYGGKIVPMVALLIAQGNEDGLQPRLILQGYIVGNAVTDGDRDDNEKIPYAHRMALVSDEYFELAKDSCHGEYVNTDPNNEPCLNALRLINQCTNQVSSVHILEPKCKFVSPKLSEHFPWEQPFIRDDPVDLLLLSKQEDIKCRDDNYWNSMIWANNETVRQALHIRKGTVKDWKRCNLSLSYTNNGYVESVVTYHQLLSERGFQALAYSGDHDMVVPYMSTLKWIRKLNLTVDEEWRPWTVDGQVAGYTEKYKNNQAYITFATVKGAGHTGPEYKPKECFEMIKRWLYSYPL